MVGYFNSSNRKDVPCICLASIHEENCTKEDGQIRSRGGMSIKHMHPPIIREGLQRGVHHNQVYENQNLLAAGKRNRWAFSDCQ